MILADEINRATPKTQSALLEAMAEHQVTAEGETRILPDPFFVIATQNPTYQIGTFPLPESQLDRFFMRIELGYPDHAAERAMLRGADRRAMIDQIQPCIALEELKALQAAVPEVKVSDALIDYLQALVEFTRRSPDYLCGLSPRASQALLRCAQAWALMEGRDYVLPEDIQLILPGVISHRLRSTSSTAAASGPELAEGLIGSVPIP